MNAWNKFWQWYENKILGSIIVIAVIQFIQVPHMGMECRHNAWSWNDFQSTSNNWLVLVRSRLDWDNFNY